MAAARSGAQRPADTRCCRRAAPDSVTAGPDSWRYSTAAPIWAAVHTGHSRRSGNPGTPAPGNRGRRRFGRADGAKLARNFLAQVEAGRRPGRGRAGHQARAGECAPGEERSGDSERWHVSSRHPCEGRSPSSTVDACRLRLRRDRNSGRLARPARAASGRPACWSKSLAIPFTIPCARRTCLPAEPLAKLLGSRLGSVLRFSGVNTPLSWISTACSGPEGPAASQETENKGIDVFSTERGDTGG